MHIPDDPSYYEKFYFTPGDLGFQAWPTAHGKIGVCVCWDQWYPESARLTALRGAQILFYPTAIGWHPREKEKYGAAQHSAWETMQRSHAIANGCYVAAINRVGHEAPAGGEGSSFGGRVSSSRRAARFSRKEASIRKRSSWPKSNGTAWTNTARIGRSSATAASTPIPASSSA